MVLEAAKRLPDVTFDVYGEMDARYKDAFERAVDDIHNVRYQGVFKGTDAEKYQLLGSFDVMLLPTRHDAEGVPGIIVESRIAGIIPIVSDWNFNSELVRDGVDGIVLHENTADELAEKIRVLGDDYRFYLTLKLRQRKAAEVFYIENYVDALVYGWRMQDSIS